MTVSTGSRLHFGLLAPQAPAAGRRVFGGAGLMVDAPGLVLRAERASQPEVHGAASLDVLARAVAVLEQLGPLGAVRVDLLRCPPQHAGLGTGTQLALALGAAASRLHGETVDPAELAGLLGRGGRSAIGVHGFCCGGFLADGGKRDPARGNPSTSLAPLVARIEFPAEWRILLFLPEGPPAWHGVAERQAFAAAQTTSAAVDRLAGLLFAGVLPALAEREFADFAAALDEFNLRSGAPFAAAQGGPFAHPWIEDAVAWLREQGAAAGQSSWGPTTYAIVPDADAAARLARAAAARFSLPAERQFLARGRNQGAEWSGSDVLVGWDALAHGAGDSA